MATIEEHCRNLVSKKLMDPTKVNDGKQTPTHGHPVFVAQHATATCCRQCLQKWHKIESTHILTQTEQNYICKVILAWINHQLKTRGKQ